MLHVRVISPVRVTGRLVDSLTADEGVVNLVLLPGAAARPAGDAVQFDVMPASANFVLQQLRDLGLDRDSSVDVETVDSTIADDTALADRAGIDRRRRFYHGERAPVWELVQSRISEGAEYAPSFFALLAFAGLIGACGILTNSQILIVGAMVVGPEYSAIIAVALGIDRRDSTSIGRGLGVLVLGFLLAIAVTLLFALCIKWSGKTPRPYLAGLRPVSDLINSPNVFSVVVAVVAGIVGVVSMTLAKSGALIGVFISITTIPAAADVGVSLAYGSWSEARGSAVQLLLNVGLLIIVGTLALRGQRLIWRDWDRTIRRRLLVPRWCVRYEENASGEATCLPACRATAHACHYDFKRVGRSCIAVQSGRSGGVRRGSEASCPDAAASSGRAGAVSSAARGACGPTAGGGASRADRT